MILIFLKQKVRMLEPWDILNLYRQVTEHMPLIMMAMGM